MLRIISRLLAGEASSDALLIVADALREAAAGEHLDGRIRQAADLNAIAIVLGAEATRRPYAGGFW